MLRALKRYGMIVADNGSSWYITGAPDPRWNDEDLNQLKTRARVGLPGRADRPDPSPRLHRRCASSDALLAGRRRRSDVGAASAGAGATGGPGAGCARRAPGRPVRGARRPARARLRGRRLRLLAVWAIVGVRLAGHRLLELAHARCRASGRFPEAAWLRTPAAGSRPGRRCEVDCRVPFAPQSRP